MKPARRVRASGNIRTAWDLNRAPPDRPTDRQGSFRVSSGGKAKRNVRTNGLVADVRHATLGTRETLADAVDWLTAHGESTSGFLTQNTTPGGLYHADRVNRAWDILCWFTGCPTHLDSLAAMSPSGSKARLDRIGRGYLQEARRVQRMDKASKRAVYVDSNVAYIALLEAELMRARRRK